MKRESAALAAVVLGLTYGAGALAAEQPKAFVPVTDAMIENPDPANWLMWRRTQNSWGYSPLKQIDKRNVGRLQLVWTRGIGPGVQEGTPLVYNGMMYFPHPSDLVQAMDAATGDIKWEYRRKLPEDLGKFFPTPTTNRNLAIYDKLIIDTSSDDFAFALDAESGKLVWETKILDYQKGAQQTSGPLIAKGKAISGRGCEPEGGPDACVILAHDAKTGKELWRTRTMPRPGEPGDATWGGLPDSARWHVGTWMVPSYDPELNLIYVGTSVTSPAPKFALAGNDKTYLYHNSTLALNADTGKIVWYYQHLVDHWDLDHPYERLLVDTVVTPDKSEVSWINPRLKPGERRKVLTGIPGKTGVVYTLDRQTGEFLWARPTVYQNVVGNIDGATGKVTVNPATEMTEVGKSVLACPSSNGGKNWPAGAYSPLTNTMYYPLRNTCSTVAAVSDKPTLESLYAIARKDTPVPGYNGKLGTVQAISVETGKAGWRFDQPEAPMSLIATGGGLLFGGDAEGHFRAFDQNSGKVLWEINLHSPVGGFPVTYTVNGKQYVAVSTGTTLGGARATAGQGVAPVSGLYVFALP
jgi:PQQ-dependent dehydrogenase (methanol/ethanol family)